MGSKIFESNMFFTVIVSILTMFFTIGIWLMDLGASMKNLEISGVSVVAESMVLNNLSGGFVYHNGLLLSMASFLLTVFVLSYQRYKQ